MSSRCVRATARSWNLDLWTLTENEYQQHILRYSNLKIPDHLKTNFQNHALNLDPNMRYLGFPTNRFSTYMHKKAYPRMHDQAIQDTIFLSIFSLKTGPHPPARSMNVCPLLGLMLMAAERKWKAEANCCMVRWTRPCSGFISQVCRIGSTFWQILETKNNGLTFGNFWREKTKKQRIIWLNLNAIPPKSGFKSNQLDQWNHPRL